MNSPINYFSIDTESNINMQAYVTDEGIMLPNDRTRTPSN